MTKVIYYTYLGTNGTITSPIHLEGIYSVKNYRLIADEDKYLTNGQTYVKVVTVSEMELPLWEEVSGQV